MKRTSDEITVLLGIDMETDVGSFTPYYKALAPGTDILLDIMARCDVAATYFFTGEAAKENPQVVKKVLAHGHEVGVHSLYHETVGDALFEIPGVKPLLEEEVPLRVSRATAWVEAVSGCKARSWRCPRLWGSTAVVNALEALGYWVDASYPLYFYRERFVPYHPAKDDWTQEGTLQLLEIPNFADMTMKSCDPPLERDRDQWPLFRTVGAQKIIQTIVQFDALMREKDLPTVLCFYFHPWEFVPCSKINLFGEGGTIVEDFIVEGCGEKAAKEFEVMIRYLKQCGAAFMRMDHYAQQERTNDTRR